MKVKVGSAMSHGVRWEETGEREGEREGWREEGGGREV